ncbi:MAG: hydrogenase iron-sulfur subunit [Gemmatimonadota bacterium]
MTRRRLRLARRTLTALDAAANRLYGWRWNPLYQSGTVAVVMLLALLGTGLYLVLVYRLGAPYASMVRIDQDVWLGRWMRSLHRYASDGFIIAAVVHAWRMLAQRRSWGPRTLAWVSGGALLAAGLVEAWTGFVMVWDSFGERLAREGARLLDTLPLFSEPLSRIFAGETAVPSAFFFVNLFVHIGLPLGLGVGLWLHVSKLACPTLLPPRALSWAIVAAFTIAAIVRPAALGDAADPLRLAVDTPINLPSAFWLPWSEQLPPLVVFGVATAVCVAFLLVPALTARARTGALAASVVDPRLCTGCNQCPYDCPWEAITMVARTDDRPTLVAQVDPVLCVSCGICAGSCAPMGVGPPGHSGRDQLDALRSLTLPALRASMVARCVVFCCAEAPASHRAALRQRGALVREVRCAGNLHSSAVELALRGGASGVLVFACPPRDCAGREGPKWLGERLFNEREAELQSRVDRRRVGVGTMAAGDLGGTLEFYDKFVRDAAALAPAVPASDLDVALECVTVPGAGDAE